MAVKQLFTPDDIVYAYTRAQAIEDGVLVDITPLASQAGFKFPVAITAAAYEQYIVPDTKGRLRGQSETGRLWDLLSVFAAAAKRTEGDTSHFNVLFQVRGKLRYGSFKALCTPGDTAEPVLTVMLPEED